MATGKQMWENYSVMSFSPELGTKLGLQQKFTVSASLKQKYMKIGI